MNSKQLIIHNRSVYNTIAQFFSTTREYNWDDVVVLADYTRPSDHVLDLGCGNGRLYQVIAKKQAHYSGLDQSEGLINIAKEKFPEAEFVLGEMSALPFADDSFDLIFCIAAFNHIYGRETQLQCLREMYRVLKSEGKILMTNWNLFSESAQKKIKKDHWKIINSEEIKQGIDVMVPWKSSEGHILAERYYHGFTMDELNGLINEVGFEIIDSYYSRKGERVGIQEGGNLISILSKK